MIKGFHTQFKRRLRTMWPRVHIRLKNAGVRLKL